MPLLAVHISTRNATAMKSASARSSLLRRTSNNTALLVLAAAAATTTTGFLRRQQSLTTSRVLSHRGSSEPPSHRMNSRTPKPAVSHTRGRSVTFLSDGLLIQDYSHSLMDDPPRRVMRWGVKTVWSPNSKRPQDDRAEWKPGDSGEEHRVILRCHPVSLPPWKTRQALSGLPKAHAWRNPAMHVARRNRTCFAPASIEDDWLD